MGSVGAIGVWIEMVEAAVIIEGYVNPVFVGKLPIIFARGLNCCEAAEL